MLYKYHFYTVSGLTKSRTHFNFGCCHQRVRQWLKAKYPACQDTLKTEWLTLSLFDLHSHFSLSFRDALTIDVTIVRDEMTVISYGPASKPEGTSGEYRKVKFHSDTEFEIFLKLELRRLSRSEHQ